MRRFLFFSFVALVLFGITFLPALAQNGPGVPADLTWESLGIPAILGAVSLVIVQFLGLKRLAEKAAKWFGEFTELYVDVYSILVNVFALLIAMGVTSVRLLLFQEALVFMDIFKLGLAAWATTTTGYEVLKNLLQGIGLLPPSPSSQVRMSGWKWC